MRFFIISAFLAALMASACSTPQVASVSGTLALRDYAPIPPQEKPVEPVISEEQKFVSIDREQKKFSLVVKEAEVRDVLFLLSKDSNIAIVADKDVEGEVTVDIKNRGLMEILYAVLRPLGYTTYIENGVVRVGRPQLVSRTFHISYNKDQRKSKSRMNAAVSSAIGGNTNSSYGGASSGSGSTSSGDVYVETSVENDFWKDIRQSLEIMVFGRREAAVQRPAENLPAASGQQGKQASAAQPGAAAGNSPDSGKRLFVNEMTGVIYVTDYPDKLDMIAGFLDDVQRIIKRQVLIQAHIVEVALNDDFSMGLDWNMVLGMPMGNKGQFSIGSKLSQSLIPQVADGLIQAGYKIIRANGQFDILVDAMKDQGQINVLSSPKISTLNNQRALIKLTTQEVSWVLTTTTTGNPPVIQTSSVPRVDEVGIFLDVTPSISDDNMITMQIHPRISEKKQDSISPDGKSTMPIIDYREVDTMVDVKSGQTIVIAGLIQDKVIEAKRGVPVLANLPLIGNAFNHVNQGKKKTELVILLTPYVLDEKSVDDIRLEHELRMRTYQNHFMATPKGN